MTTSAFTVTDLRCEYRTNPLGIDITEPRLSWRMATNRPSARQTAYRVQAATRMDLLTAGAADLWDSGRVESDRSVLIAYAGRNLTSRRRVYWQVTAWDETGQAATSEPAWFEMGLLNRRDWRARWIGGRLVGGSRTGVPAPFLRKPFRLPAPVAHARLYVTALGLYNCTINGWPVSEAVLAPGWTDFNQRVRYEVCDVTDLLHEGDNVRAAVLGDGWAVGRIGWGPRQNYADRPWLLAQLEVTLVDGRTVTVVSDGTWRHEYGPLLENDLLMGEAYDARLEWPGWDTPEFDSRHWLPVVVFPNPKARLVAANAPLVQRIEELQPHAEPVDRGNIERTRRIFDLGQNMVGRVRLRGSAAAGTTVTLRFAEVLTPEGDLYTQNLRTARATDYYTFKGAGEEVWEPCFTFHGFRYVELVDYPGPVSRDTITGVVLHSAIEPTGAFTCSDPLVNQLQRNITWGQRGNFVDVPTDCPQRDERLGWTGDIQVFARTAAFNFGIAPFMRKWLQDLMDSQGADGAIPPVAPNPTGLPMRDGGPGWADAIVICPWTVYQCYGDERILAECYPAMRRFMDFLVSQSAQRDGGYIRCAPEYEGWPGFGDWLSINVPTPRDLIGTAFLAYDAQLMARIADLLGKRGDAAHYRRIWRATKDAFAARFLKGSGATREGDLPSAARQQMEWADAISNGNLKRVDHGPVESRVFNTALFTPTQTAYVLALHFDLLPEALRTLAVSELVADIERRGMHLSTGFLGAPYLPHVLSAGGRADVAYALLNQRTWPSWLYPVTQGATTIWERWDGWTDENGFQDAGMNSFNHYAYGAIGAWLYATVAGIEIDKQAPGYKHIILRPHPGGALSQACGRLQTPHGEVVSEWTLRDGRFEWQVVIPPNTSATAYLPAGSASLNGQPVSGSVLELPAGPHGLIVATKAT